MVNDPETPAAEMKPEPPLQARIPQRYFSRSTSGLSAQVTQAGKNQVDITLTNP